MHDYCLLYSTAVGLLCSVSELTPSAVNAYFVGSPAPSPPSPPRKTHSIENGRVLNIKFSMMMTPAPRESLPAFRIARYIPFVDVLYR